MPAYGSGSQQKIYGGKEEKEKKQHARPAPQGEREPSRQGKELGPKKE